MYPSSMEQKVAIIGAGTSGLLACKFLVAKGFNPIVFEAQSSIGGLWAKTAKSTKLQTPKVVYRFSDFPWPSSVVEDFPNNQQVRDYLEAYVQHFDLLKYIRFNTNVVSIEYEGASEDEITQAWHLWNGTGEPFNPRGKWIVSVNDTHKRDSIEMFKVDFVILCLGRFSGVPNLPEFPPKKGPEVFQGMVNHSIDYAAMDYQSAEELVKGKDVTVVGFQKTALDLAKDCSEVNGTSHPCRVLYRKEHWNSPVGVPIEYTYFNRFSELLVHKPGEGLLLSLLATTLSPLRWAFSKYVENHIKRRVPLEKFGMVPKQSFIQDINSCLISTLPDKFYDCVEEGSIVLKKAPSFGFYKEGIVIEGEEDTPIKTDVVIFATGFKGDKKLRDIFVSPNFQKLMVGPLDTAIPLYRECIHPRIPQLAVIGFSSSTSNLYTSEIRSRWLAELLAGTFKVPSIKEMEKDVAEWDLYKKRYAGENYRRSCVAALHIWHNDQLCKDMGWNHRRKKGLFADLFEPYGPWDYASP